MSIESPIEPRLRYRRILLKISGEALLGQREYGLDWLTVRQIASDIQTVRTLGAEIALVIGGGNIFRGLEGNMHGMERASADQIGMLATVMNALAVQNALERLGVDTRVLSAIPMQAVCEPYIRRRAHRHLEKGRVVICAAGTGNPFFTTDTAAALARLRARLRRAYQGHQGRRRLFGRPAQSQERHPLRAAQLP